MNKTYNKRTWLNPIRYDQTSSVVAFEGMVIYDDKPIKTAFLEISDCHTKIRLYRTVNDSSQDFINKLRLLNLEIELFMIHLEQAQKPTI